MQVRNHNLNVSMTNSEIKKSKT